MRSLLRVTVGQLAEGKEDGDWVSIDRRNGG